MRVCRHGRDGSDEKYILRVQPPLEPHDDDDYDAPRCPITQMQIVEPVVAADRYTYEKRALQRWMVKKCASPMNNEPMVSWMTRNLALEEMLVKKQTNEPACEAPHKKRSRTEPSALWLVE
eukprot:5253975-Prymnesium_polylepis.1